MLLALTRTFAMIHAKAPCLICSPIPLNIISKAMEEVFQLCLIIPQLQRYLGMPIANLLQILILELFQI